MLGLHCGQLAIEIMHYTMPLSANQYNSVMNPTHPETITLTKLSITNNVPGLMLKRSYRKIRKISPFMYKPPKLVMQKTLH